MGSFSYTRWLKRNIDASRIQITSVTSISYVCKDRHVQLAYGKKIRDYSTLVAEMLSIWTALQTIILEKSSNVIIECDFLITIQDINGESKSSSQICNITMDITILVKQVDNIKFMYCHRPTNILTDKITKRAHMYLNS